MNERSIDYYEILEVHPKASPEVIQNAYRALVKKYHPDVYQGNKDFATKMMALINESYAVLSDPEKRKQYDDYKNQAAIQQGQYQQQSTSKHQEKYEYENLTPEMRQVIAARHRAVLNHEKIYDKFNISLSTFNGIGTTFLGEEDYDVTSNSYITRHWFTFFYIPIIPLGRYRVIKKDKSYLVISKITQKQSFEKIILSYFKEPMFIIGILIVLFIIFSSSTQKNNTPQHVSNTAANQQSQVQDQPAQSNIAFIPKNGITTAYVHNQPIYNTNGHCIITVDNKQNNFPVIVRIWNISPQPKPVRTFTIKQGEEFSATELTPGRYEVRYMNLYEGKQSNAVFKSQQFSISQFETEDGIQAETVRLTLYKVSNGNTKTYPISASEL